MQDIPDHDLLAQFAGDKSEEAFGELVRRHIGLVYSVALRRTDNPHQAEEITQAVFILLARKADSLGQKVVLGGWLYHTARLTAANFRRAEFRRIHHEQEAFMQSTLEETAPDPVWLELSPLLDEAMARLGATDRDAVVLRYFEKKTLSEVGAALGIEERAAQKRVSRALEKLRQFFVKRGVVSTTDIVAGAISAHSVQAVPVTLAKSVTATALAKSAAAGGSTLTFSKGVLKLMSWTKSKTAIVTCVIVLLTAGTATLTIIKITQPNYNPKDFWATSYATGPNGPVTDGVGHALDTTFSASPVQRCSLAGLLDQCMGMTGWTYLIDKDAAAGTVMFGNDKELNGVEWIAAFEGALQTNTPEWWDAKTKKMHRENLVFDSLPQTESNFGCTEGQSCEVSIIAGSDGQSAIFLSAGSRFILLCAFCSGFSHWRVESDLVRVYD